MFEGLAHAEFSGDEVLRPERAHCSRLAPTFPLRRPSSVLHRPQAVMNPHPPPSSLTAGIPDRGRGSLRRRRPGQWRSLLLGASQSRPQPAHRHAHDRRSGFHHHAGHRQLCSHHRPDQPELRGHWVLLMSSQGRCDARCERMLYATRQARTIQGRDQDRFDHGDRHDAEVGGEYPPEHLARDRLSGQPA